MLGGILFFFFPTVQATILARVPFFFFFLCVFEKTASCASQYRATLGTLDRMAIQDSSFFFVFCFCILERLVKMDFSFLFFFFFFSLFRYFLPIEARVKKKIWH